MKQKTHSKPAPANPDGAGSTAGRSDRPGLGEQRQASGKKSAEAAQAGVAREKILQAVLAAEDDRNLELARMLHDSVGQHIAAFLLGLQSLEKDYGANANARLTVQSLHVIAQSIGHELHKIALELRPTSLDDHGLTRSLTTFLEEWSVVSKIGVDFDPVSLGMERMPRHIELTLFRIVCDALRSVSSPPGASHVSVILKREPDVVTAIIEDVGTRQVAAGERDSRSEGSLANVHGRVRLLGGKLTVERAVGGTTVFARLPLRDAATEP